MNTWCDEAVSAYLEHGFARGEGGELRLKCPAEIEAWLYEQGGVPEIFAELGTLSCKTLLMTGPRSTIAPVVQLQHEQMPGSTYCVIPEGNHFVPQEQPELVAAHLEKWLGA